MIKKVLRIWNFLSKDIWSIHLREIHPKRAWPIKAMRILLISIRGIYEDKIQLRAAALTLYTLLSIVPVLALGFGIAKGFGYDQLLESKVETYLNTKAQEMTTKPTGASESQITGYEEIVNQLISFANAMLAKTKGGLVAGIGIALLFWTVMKVLSNIENSFNGIWQVKRGRPFVRKFSDYLSIMFIAPVFIITASAVNVYVNNKLVEISKHVEVVHFISPVLFLVLKVVPYLLIYMLFTIVYMIMPYTKVTFKAALIGGLIAGSVFQITQMAYIFFQIGVSSNNAIYGSFAAIPLFIIWLQISWLIVLFGAKIAFAVQNVDWYEFEAETVQMSDYSRRILALMVTHRIIQNFKKGEKPLTIDEISHQLILPMRMLKAIIADLVKSNILSEVLTDKPKITAYQPSKNIDHYSVKYVIEILDKHGHNTIPDMRLEKTQRLLEIHDAFMKSVEQHPENVLLKDI